MSRIQVDGGFLVKQWEEVSLLAEVDAPQMYSMNSFRGDRGSGTLTCRLKVYCMFTVQYRGRQ